MTDGTMACLELCAGICGTLIVSTTSSSPRLSHLAVSTAISHSQTASRATAYRLSTHFITQRRLWDVLLLRRDPHVAVARPAAG